MSLSRLPVRRPRSEDALIAYTWEQYLTTGNEQWPAQLPMTLSAVARWTPCRHSSLLPLAGRGTSTTSSCPAGQRGWTTWLTAAVDPRVAAIIPVVADTLNVQKSFEHAYNAYGYWPAAIQDYVNAGIPNWFGTPQMANLMQIVTRTRMSIGSRCPSSSSTRRAINFSHLIRRSFTLATCQAKYLRYVPNTDHSLANSDASESIQAFYAAILQNKPLPQFSWYVDAGGTLHVHSLTVPLEVKLWQATDPNARDFRLETIGAAYTSVTLQDLGGGNYIAGCPTLRKGGLPISSS